MNVEIFLANADLLGTGIFVLEKKHKEWSITEMNHSAKEIDEISDFNNLSEKELFHILSIDSEILENKKNKDWKVDIGSKSFKATFKQLTGEKYFIKLENISNLYETNNRPSELSLFQTLLNYSPDLIYFKDKGARFIKNSRSHCDFLGAKQEELIGKTDLDVFNETVAEEKYNDDINVIHTGIPIINKEEEDITSEKDRWVSSTKLPIKDNNDNIIGMFGISRDITEKRSAEQKIKKLNESFRLLITTSFGFQQTANINNLFKLASNLMLEKFEDIQLTFLFRNPINNKFDISFFPPVNTIDSSPYRNIIDYILSDTLFNKQIFENERKTINIKKFFQEEAVKGFDELKYKYASVYQLKEKNELYGYILIFRNINFEEHDVLFLKLLVNQLTLTIARINLIEELKYSIQKAKESDRLKTAFLNNISHEVRTPLNSVIGYSQVLGGRIGKLYPQLKTYAENVINNAKILLELFEDILEISKIESGDLSIIQNETNISELLDSLTQHLKEQLKRYDKLHITAENVKPDQKAIYNIDSIRVFQIVKALINNAVKFTENGSIRIGYKIDSLQEIKFYVEDSGIGIPDEDSEIIFNLFRQGDDSVTRKYGGTGIGLSIAKALAEKLGGKITFNSTPSKGSIFFFTLPIQ